MVTGLEKTLPRNCLWNMVSLFIVPLRRFPYLFLIHSQALHYRRTGQVCYTNDGFLTIYSLSHYMVLILQDAQQFDLIQKKHSHALFEVCKKPCGNQTAHVLKPVHMFRGVTGQFCTLGSNSIQGSSHSQAASSSAETGRAVAAAAIFCTPTKSVSDACTPAHSHTACALNVGCLPQNAQYLVGSCSNNVL